MATAQILQPYDAGHFNSIPFLHEAYKSYQAKNGPEFVEKGFKPLVLKHNLESQFGIGLLHRHFDLKGFEKLVELNNISSPWAVKGEHHMDGKILPCSWLISGGGKLMPYEFFFSPSRNGKAGGSGSGFDSNVSKSLDITESRVRAFLDEFLVAMEFHGLQDTLALRLFPGPEYTGGHEITHGRTNIVLTPEQASADCPTLFHYKGVSEDNSIEAAWFFAPGCIGQQRGKQTCHKYDDVDGKPCHVEVHED